MLLFFNAMLVTMTRFFLSLTLFLATLAGAGAQNADETAIQQLLEAETNAFTKMSFADVVKKFWILDEKTIANVSMPDGTHLSMSAAQMLESDVVPPEGHATFKNTEWKFRISGDVAFVTYTQMVTLEDGARIGSHEMRFLEKVNGEWKLHMSSVHQFIPKD